MPFTQEYDYRFIKPVRQLRNKTLSQFSQLMNVDPSTIGKLERNELDFSHYYESKFKDAISRLEISSVELASVRIILEMKAMKDLYKSERTTE